MNRPILNPDVLLLIFSVAEIQTKLALIATCPLLYREGGKRFPHAKYVRSRTERHLESFLQFMDADGGSRMRSLHTLDIDLSKHDPSKSLAKHLSTMLTRLAPVSRLTKLAIIPLEPFLSAHPPLSRAIATLTTTEEVRFDDVGELSLGLVGSMQAKPAKVTLLGGRHDHFKDAAGGSVLALLQHFSGNLRELCLAGFADAAHPTADTPECPLLSGLTLEATSSPTASTWHYVRAFPNLKCLTLCPEPSDYGRRVERVRLLDSEARSRNMAQLHAHGCWASLDMFSGSIPVLWRLGLPARCPVRLLDVCDKDKDSAEEEEEGGSTGMTAEVLRDVLGAGGIGRLELMTYYSALVAPGVADALVEACGDTLRTVNLWLEVAPSYVEEYVDVGEVLTEVEDMLHRFSALKNVSAVVDFEPRNSGRPLRYDTNYPPSNSWSASRWWETLSPVTGAVEDRYPGEEDMDVDRWYESLRRAVPSADSVTFFVFNHRTMRNRWGGPGYGGLL